MKYCFCVKGEGKGGAIALFWEEGVDVSLLSFDKHHIDVLIKEGVAGVQWRGSFIYGEPRVQDRHNMWSLLRRIMPKSDAPWLMIGDFNETMWKGEHYSCTRRAERQMLDFREVLSHCDLHDLGFVGLPWTYDNKQEGSRNVKVRFDRAVASPAWADSFPDAQLHHLTSSRSDH
jgi:hypothetical protein